VVVGSGDGPQVNPTLALPQRLGNQATTGNGATRKGLLLLIHAYGPPKGDVRKRSVGQIPRESVGPLGLVPESRGEPFDRWLTNILQVRGEDGLAGARRATVRRVRFPVVLLVSIQHLPYGAQLGATKMAKVKFSLAGFNKQLRACLESQRSCKPNA
jgi:hypothetical protein